MEVHIEVGDDPLFAESLTKSNMADYYNTRGILWEQSQFLSSWNMLDNYEVIFERTRVGVLRFNYDDETTFLKDFQLLPEFQGKGIGAECTDLVFKYAPLSPI